MVEMMAGWSIPEERVAKVLGIDPKTLRKHFAQELEVAHAKLEAQLAQNLLRIVHGHDLVPCLCQCPCPPSRRHANRSHAANGSDAAQDQTWPGLDDL